MDKSADRETRNIGGGATAGDEWFVQASAASSMSIAPLQKVLGAASRLDHATELALAVPHNSSYWNGEQAVFTTAALPYICSFPLLSGLVTVVGLVLRLLLPRAPLWARNFVGEKDAGRAPATGARGSLWGDRILLRLMASLAGLACYIALFSRRDHDLLSALVALSWGVAVGIELVLRTKTFSAALLVIYVCIFASEFVLLGFTARIRSVGSTEIPEALALLLAFGEVAVVLSMPMRSPDLPKDGISKPFDTPDPKLRSPEDDLTAWQFMTVSWLKPLLATGKARQINEEDVWFLAWEFQHRRLHDAFRQLQGTVVRRVFAANSLDLLITTVLAVVETLSDAAMPVLLQKILQSMENPDAPPRAAITYAFVTFLIRLLASQANVLSMWYGRRCYERSRGEMITMLYEKTLSRKFAGDDPNKEDALEQAQATNGAGWSQKFQRYVPSWLAPAFRMNRSKAGKKIDAKKPATMGKILNLMRFWEFKALVTTPLEVIVSIILVWVLLGWPCLIGMTTVLVSQALTVLMARVLVAWEKKRRAATDKKLQIISQFIEAIRYLRWYGWQGAWLKQIIERRQHELSLMMVTRACQLAIAIVNMLASSMFPVVAFWAYSSLFNRPLTVDIAFPAITLFQMLEQSVRKIPDLITTWLNAAVAMGRIQDFMKEEDKAELVGSSSSGHQLSLENATFAWPGSGKVAITNVSLQFPIGVTVVGGRVGSGKTALLLSLLGELDMISGEYQHAGTMIGYCEQRPWLQSMTIRDNILFYSPYEEARYKQVLDACALTPDLASFKHGDLSNIGENGIGLSGGQRARIALARAVYSNSRVLMLDDPLSSLDHQTAESIVNKCFGGPLMEGRTVILVTHRLDLCRNLAVQYVDFCDGITTLKPISELPTFDGTETSPKKPGEQEEEIPENKIQDTVAEKFIEEEHRAHGGIQMSVYWEYVKAGQIRWWITLIIAFSIMRSISIARIWFLKEWAEAYNRPAYHLTGIEDLLGRYPAPSDDTQPWILTFFVLSAIHCFMVSLARSIMFVIVYCAGRQMFKDVIEGVAHATFRFYDVTPVGRLMNRMTSDIGTIDGDISRIFQELMALIVAWSSSLVVIASVTPAFLVFAVIMTISFVVVFLHFLPTSQSLRRLEMTSLSPLLSDFGALVEGLTTVRAFRMQSRFQDRVIAVTDNFQRMDHFFWSAQAWMSYRLDNISALATFLLTLLGLYTGVSAGLIAFALNAAGQFVMCTHMLCHIYGRLQMDFVSVERVVELIRLEREPPGDINPPAMWPTYSGDISFKNVTIRYAPHMDPALSEVSFTLKGGTTTAITGRTGSGKSTLAVAMLATVTPESGTICIDGVDVAHVNRQALRSRITFLAQDPVLFPGTIRQNLDPTDEHSDEDCNRVLHKVCAGVHDDLTLESLVDTGGRNFSQGQRQLIGLARAILRRSAIVILDEATASIDIGTSRRVQDVLREEMRNSTVVTIAHRVEAVQDADSCLVLDQGRVAEHRTITPRASSSDS